jgi:hypothetical protein
MYIQIAKLVLQFLILSKNLPFQGDTSRLEPNLDKKVGQCVCLIFDEMAVACVMSVLLQLLLRLPNRYLFR